MTKYIADQTIKEVIRAGNTIKGLEVLVLGVTFKEDYLDMCNTKVINIIDELKDFAANVDVYDPLVGHGDESVWYKYGIIDDPLDGNKKYDAIIVAVGRKQFKVYIQDDYDFLSGLNGVIVDNPAWGL